MEINNSKLSSHNDDKRNIYPKYVFSYTLDGDKFDLELFMKEVLSRQIQLERYANNITCQNEALLIDIQNGAKYCYEITKSLQPDVSTRKFAKELGISLQEMSIANKIAISILFMYAAYLNTVGFDIKEPTKFDEVSSKLKFSRNCIVQSSIFLMQKHRYNTLEMNLVKALEDGCAFGIAIGNLLEKAHQIGPDKALSEMDWDSNY